METKLESDFPASTLLKGKSFAILDAYPDQALEQAWRVCLDTGDMPTHYASPEYFREPEKPGETRFAVLALDPQSPSLRVVGSLTGVRADRNINSGLIGTPQICVDKSADFQTVGNALAEGLRVVAKSADLVSVFSWSRMEAFSSAKFRESEETGTAALDLSAGPENTFSRLKGRSQIRHAISAGVQVREAVPEDLPAYYEIQKGWSERKQLPCPTFEYLQESFRLSNNRRLFVAFHEGKLIAGTPVRFYRGATAEYAWNVSLPDFQHLRPNDLLHWRIIEWACQQGIHTYLLGATHAFLLKYSDRIIPTYQYTKDQTLLKTHALREATVDLYRQLPTGIKDKIKQLRSLK